MGKSGTISRGRLGRHSGSSRGDRLTFRLPNVLFWFEDGAGNANNIEFGGRLVFQLNLLAHLRDIACMNLGEVSAPVWAGLVVQKAKLILIIDGLLVHTVLRNGIARKIGLAGLEHVGFLNCDSERNAIVAGLARH